MRGSESWVESRASFVYTVEGGLVARVCLYQELQEALEAAGLSE
jgi:hypothetical protein